MWVKGRAVKTAGFAFLSIVLVLSLSSYLIVHLMEDGLMHLRIQAKLNQRLSQAIVNKLALDNALESESPDTFLAFIPDNAEFDCPTGLNLSSHKLNQGRTISHVN